MRALKSARKACILRACRAAAFIATADTRSCAVCAVAAQRLRVWHAVRGHPRGPQEQRRAPVHEQRADQDARAQRAGQARAGAVADHGPRAGLRRGLHLRGARLLRRRRGPAVPGVRRRPRLARDQHRDT
eukprot:3819004-Rhodomonas_salina.2